MTVYVKEKTKNIIEGVEAIKRAMIAGPAHMSHPSVAVLVSWKYEI